MQVGRFWSVTLDDTSRILIPGQVREGGSSRTLRLLDADALF